eukprot:XP_015155719.1 acid-sensing ion channel 1 isoform X2 [Gallus gallus]
MQHTRCLHTQHPCKPIHAHPSVHTRPCTAVHPGSGSPSAPNTAAHPGASNVFAPSCQPQPGCSHGSLQNRPSLLPSPLLLISPPLQPPLSSPLLFFCSSPLAPASLHTSHSFSLLFLRSQLFPFLHPSPSHPLYEALIHHWRSPTCIRTRTPTPQLGLPLCTMPLQIFCTISFSNEEAPRDATAAGRGENGADEFLYGQEEEEEEEEDAGAATDFVAFASSCTLHGLSHIFVEGSLGARQALWAVAFLLSLSVFLYQVADRIVYYLEYHHVTLLSEEDSPEMTFPAVTFCNINRVFTRYGKCYTFNAGQDGKPRLITMKGGTGNGLEIMLDIQQDEYLPVWGETDETSFEAGIKVQIHSQDEPPLIDQLGFGVAPGFQTFVSCQEQRLIYLPPPWGDCKATTGDSEFYDTYSITACRIDCETRYLVENCNCRMVHMPGDAPYCTPEQYKECADPALDFLVEKDNEYCVCEMPCNVTRYGKELSMVKIPSKASAKYLAKKYNKSEQYIGENILVLDIFFEALNYETIEQKKAYEVAGLLGDIGGQMGLFIGASILTVLELFDYAYEVIKHRLCRRGKCRKNHKRNNTDKGVALSMDDVKRHNPCESLRGHPAGMTYAANILPHHPARGTFEDFTC